MTEQKSALEQALDLVFYAPVGLAITAREELPRLIEKGRQRVTGQVATARMIGQFAVNQGQHEMNKVAKQAGDTLASLGIIPGTPPSPAQAPADGAGLAASPAAGGPAGTPEADAGHQAGQTDVDQRVDAAPAPSGGPAPVASTNGKPDRIAGPASSGALAIPGYDSLSASQVVQRLAGLVPAELEAVRDYEASTRGRRTILNRIAQLQTGSA